MPQPIWRDQRLCRCAFPTALPFDLRTGLLRRRLRQALCPRRDRRETCPERPVSELPPNCTLPKTERVLTMRSKHLMSACLVLLLSLLTSQCTFGKSAAQIPELVRPDERRVVGRDRRLGLSGPPRQRLRGDGKFLSSARREQVRDGHEVFIFTGAPARGHPLGRVPARPRASQGVHGFHRREARRTRHAPQRAEGLRQ